jgi:hypothetical protein
MKPKVPLPKLSVSLRLQKWLKESPWYIVFGVAYAVFLAVLALLLVAREQLQSPANDWLKNGDNWQKTIGITEDKWAFSRRFCRVIVWWPFNT